MSCHDQYSSQFCCSYDYVVDFENFAFSGLVQMCLENKTSGMGQWGCGEGFLKKITHCLCIFSGNFISLRAINIFINCLISS